MPYFTIDRFEDNGWAALEREDGEMFNLPHGWLPEDTSEGDVSRTAIRTGRKEPWSSVRFYLDSEERERRIEEAKALRASIPKGRYQTVRRLAVLLIALLGVVQAQELQIHFVDVGQGDGVWIQSPSGQNIVYDGGRSPETMLNYLETHGVKSVDLVIASHPDADHIGGLAAVVAHYRPRFFMDDGIPHATKSYTHLLETVKEAGSQLLEPTARQISLGPVTLQIIPHRVSKIGIPTITASA